MKYWELSTESCKTKHRNVMLCGVPIVFVGVNRSPFDFGQYSVSLSLRLRGNQTLSSQFVYEQFFKILYFYPNYVTIPLEALTSHGYCFERRFMTRRYFNPDRIDLDEAFCEVVVHPTFVKQRDFLECFWISLHEHVRWREIELLELSSNQDIDEAA
jgi:hypothetical protein